MEKLGWRDRRISPDSGSLFQTFPKGQRGQLSTSLNKRNFCFIGQVFSIVSKACPNNRTAESCRRGCVASQSNAGVNAMAVLLSAGIECRVSFVSE
jgi:hypothetical protein